MTDIVNMTYGQKGTSTDLNELGMREMQARAFEQRNEQYLLIKSPPASGKSRALMFLALDKLINQGLRKAIVAVPEMSIGSSFKSTKLTDHGFFADWQVKPQHNLCIAGSNAGKVTAFTRFMTGPDNILVCTHATLRFAFDKLDPGTFNGCVIAIDEFHHVSANENSRLGGMIDILMNESDAHLVAMTGSYFRGDNIPIMLPEDEAKFTKVTYSYYEQLEGYRYLKSLGIGYHFYQGSYITALPDVLDATKKTLIHIPNVNSSEAGNKDKYSAVDAILDVLGTVTQQEPETGIYLVQSKRDGKLLRVADLVNDSKERIKIQTYLRHVRSADDVDIIIALGMAKEGFDWPYCEHVLTIGFRSSITEIVQIIGRATRDCEGKTHAQFTNLIAQPDAEDGDVVGSVNNMLKAITTSLLMEQIMAPNIEFIPRSQWTGEPLSGNTIVIDDNNAPISEKAKAILNGDKEEIMAAVLTNTRVVSSLTEASPPEVYTQVALPEAIQRLHPDLTEDDVEYVRKGILHQQFINQFGGMMDKKDLPLDAVVIEKENNPKPDVVINNRQEQPAKSDKFIKMGDKFINIEDLHVDLVESVNPFHGGFEVLSKSVTPAMLKTIQETVRASRAQISEEEAIILYPKVKAFVKAQGRHPSLMSNDPLEVRYAEALAYVRKQKQQRLSQQG